MISNLFKDSENVYCRLYFQLSYHEYFSSNESITRHFIKLHESYFVSDISIFESLDFATYTKGQDEKATIESNMAEDLIQILPSILHFI